ncbi:tetratricopeptide repeat protein [Aquisphaera giovannonii]|uniref:tetratricopeptide repeat protein n=1 Tax=Aquisphaera giovannonii TaxID=406548 RepID=UPI001AEFB11B|nr:tetratricopeptide repeat protein [Aquisphaera giovannonii]
MESSSPPTIPASDTPDAQAGQGRRISSAPQGGPTRGSVGGRRRLVISAAALAAAGGVWLGVRKAREELGVRAEAEAARRYMAEQDYEQALPHLQRWVQARPASGEAMFLVAKGMFATGTMDQGFAALERARALGYPGREIDRQRGLALSGAGKHREAEPLLRRALEQSTAPDPAVEEALARTLLETFRLREAREVIERWIRDAPDDARTYLWKAIVDRKTDTENDVLIEDYTQALKRDPGNIEARRELGGLYLQLHRLDDAAKEYESLLARSPGSHDALLGLAQVAMERGDEEQAVGRFRQAIEAGPRDVRPLLELAKYELRLGRVEAAMSDLDRALKVDGSEPDVHYLRSLAFTRLGMKEEAKAEREATDRLRAEGEVLKKLQMQLLNSPGDVEAQVAAARWMFEHGHPDEGVRWGEKILREHPGHTQANLLLADHYAREGKDGLANFYRLRAAPGPSAPR